MDNISTSRTPDKYTIRNNFMFCHVMSKNPELCKELLELILADEIKEIGDISLIQSEKTVEVAAGARGIRLDVYVKDEKGSVYDIEMQVANQKNLLKRTRYYLDQIDIDNLDHGQSFEALKDTYIIFICPFNFRPSNLPRYTLTQTCMEEPDGDFSDGSKKIIICATPETIKKEERLRQFYRYIIEDVPEEGFTSRLDNAVQAAKDDPEWRRIEMYLEEFAEEYAKEQIKKASLEAKEQGREEGREEGALAIIRAMLAGGTTAEQLIQQGVPVDLISKAQETEKV